MAHNPAPLTGVERHFDGQTFIVSMTDTKGVIEYFNQVGLDISGYTESEILGQQHNILRHPDMPRCIFQYIWDTIAKGDEVLAYFINKCKNGDHYWVFAHVTPTFDDDGNIVGYFSSRRPASAAALEVVKPLYKQLVEVEGRHSRKKEGMHAGAEALMGTLKSKGVSYSEMVMSL